MAERYLLHFKEIEADYEEQKEAYVNYKENDDNVGGGRSGVGNPTEQKALKNIEYDNLNWLRLRQSCLSLQMPNFELHKLFSWLCLHIMLT